MFQKRNTTPSNGAGGHKKILWILPIILLVLVLCGCFFWKWYNMPRVRESLTVEVGTKSVTLEQFLVDPEIEAQPHTDLSALDLNHLGSYSVEIKAGPRVYISTLQVVDTQPPSAVLTDDRTLYNGEEITPEMLVKKVNDRTRVTLSFAEEYDFSQTGERKITVVLTDEGGNTTRYDLNVTITNDIEPPVISGVQDITVAIGETVTYRDGVSVADDVDPSVQLKIDTSQVNLKREGTYPVTYSATDAAGNTASVSCNLTVTAPTGDTVNEEVVAYYAQQVLDEIIEEDMTQAQIAYRIYSWCRSHLNYVSTSEKDSWLKGAYQGFTKNSGDCFIFFSTAKALLNQAGIKNVDIEKSPVRKTRHYWNLVDVGTGYYHFDTTPRRRGDDNFFMRTDAQLEEYSSQHYNSHAFDHSLYPDRAEKPFDLPYTYDSD